MRHASIPFLLAASVALPAQERDVVLPRAPRVSPDGAQVAFAWRGDIWVAPTSGGDALRVTSHPGDDDEPAWSPDGRTLAFVSDRVGGTQVFVGAAAPDAAAAPRQVTFESGPKALLGFTPDGEGVLVAMPGDAHFHGGESRRLWRVDIAGAQPKRLLLDAGFATAALAPDGKRLLFTRGRAQWWRKGYVGAAAEQVWLADLGAEPPVLTRLSQDRPGFQNTSEASPMWAPDGAGYYFVGDPDGVFDVWYRRLDGSGLRRITDVLRSDGSDDGVVAPSLSADGRTLVVRRRFGLLRVDTAAATAAPIPLLATGDAQALRYERRTEKAASEVAWTRDGKQMAFVAGEDVYVMDRVLKEPVRVTATPHRERDLVFAPDGKSLWFTSDAGGEVDVHRVVCPREDGIWWLGREFAVTAVTADRAVEGDLRWSPKGDRLAFARDNDLWVMDADGGNAHLVVETWSGVDFDWSPDGKWLVWATQDDDSNSDVWLAPIDGSRPPFHLSRHPGRDAEPRWSPDGTRIAFVGQREDRERDVFYVNLTKGVEEKTGRDRKLEEALEAMKKKPASSRGDGATAANGPRGRRRGSEPATEPQPEPQPEPPAAVGEPVAADDRPVDPAPEKPAVRPGVEVAIDFDGILDRVHRIRLANSAESGLLWSPDGKKLGFQATVDNEAGFHIVEFPEVGKPKRLARQGLSRAVWLEADNQIVGLAASAPPPAEVEPPTPPGVPPRPRGAAGGGVPAVLNARGEIERFEFAARQVRDWGALREVAFDQGWRAMRDRFYDERLNHRDWDAVRTKYRAVAAACLGRAEWNDLMNLMLGELNASHMGHSGGAEPLPQLANAPAWTPTTWQLGLRFATPGPQGLPVRSVIPGSPCAQAKSRVEPGETLVAVDGRALDGSVDLDRLLTLDEVRDVELTVRDVAGSERKIVVRPIASVAGLLYEEYVQATRRAVEAASGGRLGYLHIRSMDMRSVQQMEEDLYAAGAGKDGLIVDVRWNGGGNTADHVLTMLMQPRHAITRSRGSGDGYPVDRKVYASWSKPIVLMCNEYSFSNAEILAHAVKQAGRGRLVGMRTGGGVISTGSQSLADGSVVRMPTRGWYLVTTGEDMELNGCLPDLALWNAPNASDAQLAAAIDALRQDVAAAQARGVVEPVPASVKRAQLRNGDGTTGQDR